MVQEESVHISKVSYFAGTGLGSPHQNSTPLPQSNIGYVFSTWQPFTLYYTGVENDS